MKEMTCRQLGGACDEVFRAQTFDEIAELSKKHGIKMMQAHDDAHLKAMDKMRSLMDEPEKMQQWYEEKKTMFASLPDLAG